MSQPKYFIVNVFEHYIIPFQYKSYEEAHANCNIDEMVYLAESFEELECCLDLEE